MASDVNNFVPYVQISTSKGYLKFLIDTGANKNYISPKHVNIEKCRFTDPVNIHNINGIHAVNQFVEFNPFMQIPKTMKIKFYIFDFHPFFDGLIGYEALQLLKTNILTSTNELQFPYGKVKMLRKYPCNTPIQLNANETKIINIPVNIEKGDFLVKSDTNISDSIFVHSGLYSADNYFAYLAVTNISKEPTSLDAVKPFEFELNNFETQNPPKTSCPMNRGLFDQLRLEHLNSEERKQLLKTISEHQDVFLLEGEHLTFTNAIKHSIKTKDDLPIFSKSYRYPFCHREEVQKQISQMLDQGIIRHSVSPWTSPVWIVPKKMDASGQKKWRLVIDYRKLNDKTISDRYPIPNISDILDKLGRCNYFTTLDLASGFHQIEVEESDIPKTAFNVENGHYEFLRMPFGLKNAPSTFQRVMDNILREHIGIRCFIYMDDIIIFSTSLQEHLDNLKKIFNTLSKYNMKVQLDKCEFLSKEVAFLGHIVTIDGVKPNPDKIEIIKHWPLPKTEKELRGFLGILGYYRKFIKDFAKIAKPLTNSLRKGEKLCHTEEFMKAFNKCKNILTSSDILQYPDFTKPFILTTDASNHAIGAVLSQGQIGRDRPIAFASRTLNKTEENYSTIEKELLGIVWGCKHFRPYLYGRKFTLYTDHKPLTYSLNLKEPNQRLIHWRLSLAEFDYDVHYKPGKQNVVADGLSRVTHEININEQESSSDDATMHSADTDDSEFIQCTEKPLNYFSNQIILRIGPEESNVYEEVFPKMHRRTITKLVFGVPQLIRIFKENMDLKRSNCILCPENLINNIQIVYKNYFSRCKTFKIFITQKLLIDLRTAEEQSLLIEQTHESAHRGVWENKRQISKRFFFPKMKFKIQQYIKVCEVCNKNKYDRHPYKIRHGSTPNTRKPLEIIHIDIFITKPNIFLSAIDKFSRFGVIIPIKSRTITDIRKGLLKYFSTYGTPGLIVSDNEPALRSAEIRGLIQNLNIQMHFVPANHSESNGMVERFHSTLAEIFRCIKKQYADLNDKEIFLIACTLYNNTVHSGTGLKPREIFYGLKDGQERPLNIERMVEERNKFYDEVILTNEKTRNKDLLYHNKNRERQPHMERDKTIYKKVQGIKRKTKERYIQTRAMEDKGRITLDSTGREVHKENIKRL